MKILLLTLCSQLFLSVPCSAQQTTTTSTGAIFSRVTDPDFGLAWKAPNGAIWSPYQGVFSNQGQLSSQVITDNGDFAMTGSSAVNVCEKMHGQLPSIQQYRDLMSQFSPTSASEFEIFFPMPASASPLLWTQNAVNADFARFAKALPFLDPFGDVTSTAKLLSVFCVHH